MNPMNDNVHYQDLGIFLGYPKWQLSGPSCISSGAGLSLELHGPHFWVGPTPTLNTQKTTTKHTHTIDIDKYMVTCNLIYFWPTRLQKNGPLRAKLPASATPARVFTTPLFCIDIVEARPCPGFHNASSWVPHCVLRNKYVTTTQNTTDLSITI